MSSFKARGNGMQSADLRSLASGVAAAVDLRDVLAGLWRRKRSLIVTTVMAALAGAAFAFSASPRYAAEARVIVDKFDTAFSRSDRADENGRDVSEQLVTSQLEVLRSRDIAKHVVNILDLTENPEFSGRGVPVSMVTRALAHLGFVSDPRNKTPEQLAIEAYYRNLVVYVVPKSQVIAIEVTSRSPETAAKLANAVADSYVVETRQAQSEPTGRARDWLAGQIEELRGKVVASETAAEEFRAKAGLLKGTSATLGTQELSELNSQIILAESNRSEAQAKAKAIRELLARTGTVDASVAVLDSPLIQRLREQQVVLMRTRAELATVYLGSHPKLIAISRELADLDRLIRAEALKIVDRLDQEARIAAAREGSLRSSLNDLKSRASETNVDDVKLRALEREAAANRSLLETFLNRYTDARARETVNAQPGLARVISRADVPTDPSYPKRGPIVVLSMIAGFTIALGLAFLAEVMSAIAELERQAATPEPIMANDPAPSSAPFPAAAPAAASSFDLRSAMAQPALCHGLKGPSLTIMGSWIQSQRQTLGVKRVAIVSLAGEDDEKAVVTGLGRWLAALGTRVMAVDCDLQETGLGADDRPGLAELLSGAAAFSAVVVLDTESPLQLIPAGRARAAGAELLASARFDAVLEALDQSYEIVLMDLGRANPETVPLVLKSHATLVTVSGERVQDAALLCAALAASGVRAARFVVLASGAPAPIALGA
jgi:succinoglycan biosynthesis transport protein ExoP